MLRRTVWFGLLIAAALLARVALVADKQSVEHDEAISYLAAAGHLGDYERIITTGQYPYDQWAAARAWQKFIEPKHGFVFGQIARDLARYDVHPPLYFWLLHLWTRLSGVAAWSGLLLNVLIDVATGIALHRLARGAFTADRALAVVMLWALSPVALRTMTVARPYSLFTLMVVLYALAVQRFTAARTKTGTRINADGTDSESAGADIRSFLRAIVLIVTGAAGLLTHFYFFLALIAGGLVVLAQRDRTRVLEFGAWTLLSGGIFVALHPHFLIAVQGKVQGHFAWSAFPDRLGVTLGALALLSIPTAAALILPLISLIGQRSRQADHTRVVGYQSEIFLLCLLGGQIVLYLLQISPKQALMEYRYLAPTWPCAALVLVRVLRTRAQLACVGMLALAGIVAWPDSQHTIRPAPGTHILIDNPARGVLLPVVMTLDADTPVFAADQVDLLAEPDRWLLALRRDGGLYSYLPLYAATEGGHAAILDLIAAVAEVTPAPERFVWQADFHRDQEQVMQIAKESVSADNARPLYGTVSKVSVYEPVPLMNEPSQTSTMYTPLCAMSSVTVSARVASPALENRVIKLS